MVFGTFDILHPGHIHFLNKAKGLGDFLIVSLATRSNIKKIKKRHALHTELERKKLLESLRMVDRVVIGAESDYLKHIMKEKPDVIALGYDQKHYTDGLETKLSHRGLKVKVVRIEAFQPSLYKSSRFRYAEKL